jgi:hypothetical protein
MAGGQWRREKLERDTVAFKFLRSEAKGDTSAVWAWPSGGVEQVVAMVSDH